MVTKPQSLTNSNRFYPEIQLNHDSPVPLHHQLAENIRNSLIRNRIPEGTPLPSMLTLAEDLNLNRDTVRRSYGTLENEGVLARSPGKRILQVTPHFANSYGKAFLPAIGMVLPDRMEDLIVQPGKSALEIVCGIMDAATDFGFAAMVVPLPERDEDFYRLQDWLKEMTSKLNGLIYLGESNERNHEKAFELLLAETIMPQVFIGGHAFREHLGVVTLDLESGFVAAANHLYELGHRQVAALGAWIPKRNIFQLQTYERTDCMFAALRHCFKQPEDLLLRDCLLDDATRNNLKQILSSPQRPTAIIFSSDELTIHCLPVIKEMGMKIPEDISLISFGNSSYAQQHTPSWTAICNPRRLSGKTAVEMIAQSRSENIPVNQLNRKLPSSLIIRNSTAKPHNIT